MNKTIPTITGVQTLLRGLAVIDAVVNGCHDLKRITEHTGTARSTIHRLASALVEQRYLRYTPEQGYMLGSKLIELGARALESTSLHNLAQPILQKLASLTHDTVHLGIREGDEVLYLEKVNSQRGLEMRSRPGHRMPLPLTGIGKALILDCSEEEWQSLYLKFRDNTQLNDFMKNIKTYAAGGYAFDLEENEPTIRCVAVPVYDASRVIVAAISVASTATYMSYQRMEELIPHVKACASEISTGLGWSDKI